MQFPTSIVVLLLFAVWSAGHRLPQPVVLRVAASQMPAGVPAGAVSADGRYVAFTSLARLLEADTDGVEDIYVLDRETGQLAIETLQLDDRVADGSAVHPQISADGRYVAYESLALGLTMAPDGNDCGDVFVRDRMIGRTRHVSVGRDGAAANGPSRSPAISDDGAVLAFESHATNLVAGEDENGDATDVYVFHRDTGNIARAGVDSDGRPFGQTYGARLSADGRFVVFTAKPRTTEWDDALVRNSSVHLRDLAAGTTTCVSCGPDGRPGRAAFAPDISADGRLVAFVVQTTPRHSDIVVHDRVRGSGLVVTEGANASSAAPRLSGDGRMVAFESLASNLLCRRRCTPETLDENVLPDVYLYERAAGTFRRASGARGTWWAPAVGPDIDRRGEVVIFSSREAFGPEDATADFDLFVCAPVCP